MKTVTVCAPYQVALDDTVYGPDETAMVPDDVAERWLTAGWVELAPATAA